MCKIFFIKYSEDTQRFMRCHSFPIQAYTFNLFYENFVQKGSTASN